MSHNIFLGNILRPKHGPQDVDICCRDASADDEQILPERLGRKLTFGINQTGMSFETRPFVLYAERTYVNSGGSLV